MAAPTRLTIPALLLAVALTGCGGSGGSDASETSSTASTSTRAADESSRSTTSSTTTPTSTTTSATTSTTATTTRTTSSSTTTASSTSTTTSTPASTTSTAATGPQECGKVTTVNGSSVTVSIVSGDHDCTFAEDLLDRYYNNPPSPLQGSGGFVTIDGWDCMTTTIPETERSGVATTCSTPGGDSIRTTTGAGSSSSTTESGAGATPSESTGSCAQIDQPTLDQLFPDGVLDEETCRSYIGGENAVDADR